MIYLITGGARSGKSSYAERLARHFGGDKVTYVATLEPTDAEMTRRIKRHQAQRPDAWETLESPLNLATALQQAQHPTILVDCLSGFVSNILLAHEQGGEEAAVTAVLKAVEGLCKTLSKLDRTVIVVTNEVGDGVVPPYPLGRWYRDALGLANQRVAHVADAVSLVTVGLPQALKGDFPL